MPKKKKISLDRKKNLYLKEVPKKGRGVFCTTNIRAGEILETTPAILLNEKDTLTVDKTALVNYTFVMGGITKRLRQKNGIKDTADCSSVIMGIASFCNHGEVQNAEIIWQEDQGTLYYMLKAIKNIPKDTEICTSYGDGWFDDRE